jgi:DUF1009 family protein
MTPVGGSGDVVEGRKGTQETIARINRMQKIGWKTERKMVRCS